MGQREVMHTQISKQMPYSETRNEEVYVPSPPRTEELLDVSQHMHSMDTSKEEDLQPAQMLPDYVGFKRFHQQGQQRPPDSLHAHPSLSLSLERPDMYGTMYSQQYQESPVPPPFTRGTFDAKPSDAYHPIDLRQHGGGSSRPFDLEQQPFQHAEQPNTGSYNVSSGDVQGSAYHVQGVAYHGQGEIYQTQKGMESEERFGICHEPYHSHQSMESGAHMAFVPRADGSLEQGSDDTVPASEYPPHDHGGHQQYYPVASATHDAVVQDVELFRTTLYTFLAALGTRLTIPKVTGLELNLHAFYCEVTARGGFVQVIRLAQWKEVSERLGISKWSFNTPYVLRKHYTSLLFHYEQVYYFRVEGKLVTPPVPLPAPNAVEPIAEVDSPYEAPAELAASLKKRKRKLDPMQVFGVDPAAAIGTVVTGAINGKSDEGYYVSVVVGSEKLSGVLYHFSAESDNHQFAKVPSLIDGIGSEDNTAGLEIQIYGKQRTETIKKKDRDPNAPKRSRTGYNIYFKEQCEKLRLLHPDMKGLGKKVIEMWGKLPENEKSLYNARGSQEREQYLIEHREKMKAQPQAVATPSDAVSTDHSVGEQDHDAYYVSNDYHVSLEPENDLNSEHPQLSDIDQAYHAYHANGPQSNPPDSEVPGESLISEQAYEMQEDEADYTQEPGSDEDEDDAEQEETYEGEEDEETVYPSEKGYEEQDGNNYQTAGKGYSTHEGMFPFPQNEAVVHEPRTHDTSGASKQPYYGQEHGYVYVPALPPQMMGSQGSFPMKSMGQSYQMQENGKIIYPHLKPGPAETPGDAMVSQQPYLTQGRYAYPTAKGGHEALGVPTQEQAVFHRQDETPTPLYPAPFHRQDETPTPLYPAPFHQSKGAVSGIQMRQAPPEQVYQERYAYPMHFPPIQMYARPSPQGYPVRFPHPSYPVPWSESQAMQYGHGYAPQMHQPQASIPDVSGAVSASQAYPVQEGGHGYQS